MSVILVGYRGSGKTSVAQRLAQRLGWILVDTDQQIVLEAGKSIRKIFDDSGETAFRDIESFHVRAACEEEQAVISLGGGAVLREENRDAIKSSTATCVYLCCNVDELTRRIHADPATASDRPALTPFGGTHEEIAQLLEMREPLYRQVATREIDVTMLPIGAVVDRIMGWL